MCFVIDYEVKNWVTPKFERPYGREHWIQSKKLLQAERKSRNCIRIASIFISNCLFGLFLCHFKY